jgi:hypothetical protein
VGEGWTSGLASLGLPELPWQHCSAWLDPELPATYQVVKAVLAEIGAVFPGPYIFIGGDEPFGMPED